MYGRLTAKTLETIKSFRATVTKAQTTGITQATGIVDYDLEQYAKTLYAVQTPIRQTIPRVTSNRGDTATHWKAIIAINSNRTNPGKSEGHRGASIDQTEADRVKSYKGLALENSITEEAIMAAEGFDNALAIMGDNLLRAMMIAEEEIILTGNGSLSLGTPTAPTGVAGTNAAATLPSGTYKARVVALTYDGLQRASVAGGVVTTFTKNNNDGTSDTVAGGSSQKSAASAGVAVTLGQQVTWTWPAVPGAFGYALYVDVQANDPNEILCYVGSFNSFVQTAASAGTQLASAITADNSANSLVFDGLLTQLVITDSNSKYAGQTSGYYKSLDGATLTGHADGSIDQFDTMLEQLYLLYKVTPDQIWVSTDVYKSLKHLAFVNGATSFRLNISSDPKNNGSVTLGTIVGEYLNGFAIGGGKPLPVAVHPNLPAGNAFFDCATNPLPLANIPGARRMKMRRDFYQRLWPQTTDTRYTSVQEDGLLELYIPFAMAWLQNIGAS